MVDERRKPETSGLRRLFSEQWAHILKLIDARERKLSRAAESETFRAIETIVSGTNVQIRGIGNYRNRLRAAARIVLDHVNQLVDGLPEASPINPQNFRTNPLANSFFVNREDMQTVFSASRELQDYFAGPGRDRNAEIYALLFAMRREKTAFGKDLKGDMLISDVMQTSVNFEDHSIVAPCDNETELRKSLKTILFNSIVSYIQTCMTQRVHQQTAYMSEHPLEVCNSLKNPLVYLEELISLLGEPDKLLKLQQNMLRISRMGIKLAEGESGAHNEVRLQEVEVGGTSPRVVLLVKYPGRDLRSFADTFSRAD